MRSRDDSGSNRGRRTAARASRGVLQVPWVARGAEQPRLSGNGEAKLRGVGLSEDHGAGTLVACDELGVVIGKVVREKAAAVAGNGALIERVQIFQHERHAAQRAVWQTRTNRRARLII